MVRLNAHAENGHRIGVPYVQRTNELAERAGFERLKSIGDGHRRGAYAAPVQITDLICYGRPIQAARRIGARVVLILALACASWPAAGWAASRNRLTVSGPHHVATGSRVELHFRGHAARHVHRLVVWLDNHPCADRAKVESQRKRLLPPSAFRVHGNFRAQLTIEHSSKGTHVVCAYLLHHHTRTTEAHASWRYATG